MREFADRVKETSTSTGTGNITLLGAEPAFSSFSSQFGLNDFFKYAIIGNTTEWETGLGYITNSNTLVRDTIYASSNSGLIVSFSSGTKNIFNTLPAFYINSLSTIGVTTAINSGLLFF